MDTKKIRDYFLTSQEDLRQEDFELTSDASVFELAEQVESELVDDYILGVLTSSERKAFETNYLVTEERRAKVASAERLARAAADFRSEVNGAPAFSWSGWIFANKFALSTAVAILIVIGLLAYAGLHRESPTEIARTATPARIEPVEDIVPPAPTVSKDVEKPVNANTDETSKKFTPATISLSPRNFRNSGREIVILKDDASVPFLMKLETEPGARIFSSYSVRIETPEGSLVPSSTTILGRTKTSISVSVVGKFDPGTYIVYLVGMDDESGSEPVGEYAFRVIQR